MKIRIAFILLLACCSFDNALASTVNPLCGNALIKSLIVDKAIAGIDRDDICALTASATPPKARAFLQQIENANRKISQSLALLSTPSLLGDLTIELKVSDLGIIDSAFEIINNQPTVRLGTKTNSYFENFSKTIYTHEMGHWYLSYYLNQTEGLTGLSNIPTFQEFFADALVLSIYGSLDTSDIDAPYCIRQIRNVGTGITFSNSIGEFDYASYFRKSNQCCLMLSSTGKETDLSRTVCKENKSVENFYFPNGLPSFSQAPLNYNVHSLYLNTELNKNRLEPHRSSAPMNSFLLELSREIKTSIMDLVLPALKTVAREKIAYKCGFEEVLKQGIYDLVQSTSLSKLDYLFLEIRNNLETTAKTTAFDKLYKKYYMNVGQVIIRNELLEMAKFTLQVKLKDNLISAWKAGKYSLPHWQCINQQTGELSSDCNTFVACMPEDQKFSLRREFLRRDGNKSIFTPIVKFVNEETQKEVVFVGLNHTGPGHYYKNVRQYLSHKLATPENLALREFFTCKKNQTVLNSNVVEITSNESSFLNTYLKELYYPFVFFQLDFAGLSPLFKTYQLNEESCVVDLDNKTLRPRSIVERNERVCNKAHNNSIECQWEATEKLLSSLPNTKEGDLILSEESPSVQISSINMYKGLPSGGNLELWTQLLIPTNYVLNDYREENLVKNVFSAFSAGKKRVILPWGVGHIQAIKELLYKNGFKQFEIAEISYANMSDYGLDGDIDSMLKADFDYIGDEYRF